jgi:hypothetical protein
MFPNDRAAGSDVEVNNQQLATCCVRADADDTALARHGVLVHFAGLQHVITCCYGAGVRPWRRMTSAILTLSGGPPAALRK